MDQESSIHLPSIELIKQELIKQFHNRKNRKELINSHKSSINNHTFSFSPLTSISSSSSSFSSASSPSQLQASFSLYAIENYSLIQEINDSRFGHVYIMKSNSLTTPLVTLAKDHSSKSTNHHIVLVKKIDLDTLSLKDLNNILYHILLEHNNLFKIYTIKDIKDTTSVQIYFEQYVSDLENEMKYHVITNTKFHESDLSNILFSVLDCLAYLQACNLAHENIIPSQIYLSKNNVVKITDNLVLNNFSKRLTLLHQALRGKNLRYLAPELLSTLDKSQQQQYDPHSLENLHKCDIWSLGMCILDAGTLINADVEFINTKTKTIDETKLRERINMFKCYYSKALSDMVEQMLIIDSKKRLLATQLLEDKFKEWGKTMPKNKIRNGRFEKIITVEPTSGQTRASRSRSRDSAKKINDSIFSSPISAIKAFDRRTGKSSANKSSLVDNQEVKEFQGSDHKTIQSLLLKVEACGIDKDDQLNKTKTEAKAGKLQQESINHKIGDIKAIDQPHGPGQPQKGRSASLISPTTIAIQDLKPVLDGSMTQKDSIKQQRCEEDPKASLEAKNVDNKEGDDKGIDLTSFLSIYNASIRGAWGWSRPINQRGYEKQQYQSLNELTKSKPSERDFANIANKRELNDTLNKSKILEGKNDQPNRENCNAQNNTELLKQISPTQSNTIASQALNLNRQYSQPANPQQGIPNAKMPQNWLKTPQEEHPTQVETLNTLINSPSLNTPVKALASESNQTLERGRRMSQSRKPYGTPGPIRPHSNNSTLIDRENPSTVKRKNQLSIPKKARRQNSHSDYPKFNSGTFSDLSLYGLEGQSVAKTLNMAFKTQGDEVEDLTSTTNTLNHPTQSFLGSTHRPKSLYRTLLTTTMKSPLITSWEGYPANDSNVLATNPNVSATDLNAVALNSNVLGTNSNVTVIPPTGYIHHDPVPMPTLYQHHHQPIIALNSTPTQVIHYEHLVPVGAVITYPSLVILKDSTLAPHESSSSFSGYQDHANNVQSESLVTQNVNMYYHQPNIAVPYHLSAEPNTITPQVEAYKPPSLSDPVYYSIPKDTDSHNKALYPILQHPNTLLATPDPINHLASFGTPEASIDRANLTHTKASPMRKKEGEDMDLSQINISEAIKRDPVLAKYAKKIFGSPMKQSPNNMEKYEYVNPPLRDHFSPHSHLGRLTMNLDADQKSFNSDWTSSNFSSDFKSNLVSLDLGGIGPKQAERGEIALSFDKISKAKNTKASEYYVNGLKDDLKFQNDIMDDDLATPHYFMDHSNELNNISPTEFKERFKKLLDISAK